MPRIYFPGLNGIRFLAALAVVLGHCEFYKSHVGIPNFNSLHALSTASYQAVTLFFVLRGLPKTPFFEQSSKSLVLFFQTNLVRGNFMPQAICFRYVFKIIFPVFSFFFLLCAHFCQMGIVLPCTFIKYVALCMLYVKFKRVIFAVALASPIVLTISSWQFLCIHANGCSTCARFVDL